MTVVDLLEVVYVRHEHAQGPGRRYRRIQAVLELLVEALLGQETGQVVPVDQAIQRCVKLRFYGISFENSSTESPITMRSPSRKERSSKSPKDSWLIAVPSPVPRSRTT